jgi:hypothetical protein
MGDNRMESKFEAMQPSLTNFKLVSDLGQNYNLHKILPTAGCAPALPQDHIMDITEYERFNEYTYPKLKQLLDAKTKLIEARHHAPLVYQTKSIRLLDLM